MPKIVDVRQGTPEWLKVREGRITASKMGDVVWTLKNGKKTSGYDKYKMVLIAERLTGRAEENYVSSYMDWGTEYEPMARAAYEVAFDVLTDQIGFAIHPSMDFSGASPDGLVGPDGCLEIKCPKTTTHLGWKLAGVVPEEHIPQMVWEMECCERQWCDFISYDPRLPPDMQIFSARLPYDAELAKSYRAEVRSMNDEINTLIEKLGGKPGIRLRDQLRKAVDLDAEMMITNLDKPEWMREMGV